jgi:hypothetical protein
MDEHVRQLLDQAVKGALRMRQARERIEVHRLTMDSAIQDYIGRNQAFTTTAPGARTGRFAARGKTIDGEFVEIAEVPRIAGDR